MDKKCDALGSKIWFLFLYTAVITSLIMVISTVSFAAKKAKKGSAAIININTADEKTLESLPGIGKATAKAIIKGRPYKSIDDLKRVKGMSHKKIEALKGKVSVGRAAATTSTSAKKSVSRKSSKAAKKLMPGQRININTSDEKTLESLPGVGKATAKAIIAGRPYKSIDDLKRVKGMSHKKIAALKGKVSVGRAAASTSTSAKKSVSRKSSKAAKKLMPGQHININSASKEDLQTLPGIGPSKAQAIIDGRPFAKPEDIMKIKGIKQKTFYKLKNYITTR